MRRTPWQLCGLVLGILAFVLLCALDTPLKHQEKFGARPALAAAVTALMAIWWLSEALPIYVTACVPLVLFPLLGVFGGGIADNLQHAALPYVDPYIFLFMGGMCIAAAMQQWGLHRRIALGIMVLIGTEPRRLLLGILCATAFISLWISNTATATMMVPIGIAIIGELELRLSGKRLVHYGAAIMMAIAYASNVGGIGTKIGTAPNAQFAGFMERTAGVEIPFLGFMVVGLGFVVLFLPIVWWRLWIVGRTDAPAAHVGESVVREEMHKLGRMQRGEWVVLVVFLAAAALWIAGKPLTDFLKPRVHFIELRTAHVEGAIAMLAAACLLLARVQGRAALGLPALRLVPWETLLLLGGSFSMAAGVQESGLSDFMAQRMSALSGLPAFQQVLAASVATVAVSSIASNTATIGLMLPLLWGTVSRDSASTVLFAATIAASCDFALPAGTPPNAIVFGSGYVTIPRMARTGVVLDLLAAIVCALWCSLAVRWIL